MTPIHDKRSALVPARRRSSARCRSRRGMVLILVLLVIVVLSLSAIAFSLLMVSEREVATATGRQIQALALAESGIEAVKGFLAEKPDLQLSEGEWYNNTEKFFGVVIVEDADARGQGRFSVVAPGEGDEATGVRFGLECESAKLNLNTLLSENTDEQTARDRLMTLPDMTEELADCILDWLDSDDESRASGAERDYYESLDSPYRPTNGPIASLEDLLFVKGVTAWHLYGADRNRNGVIDADESTAAAGADSDGSLHCGWSAYLTLHSRETFRTEDGEPKINLNQDDAKTLHQELSDAVGAEWANFIVAYRQQEEAEDTGGSESSESGEDSGEGNQDSEGGSRGEGSSEAPDQDGAAEKKDEQPDGQQEAETEEVDRVPEPIDLEKPLKRKLESVLDLIGSSVEVEVEMDGGKKTVKVVPLFTEDTEQMRDYLPKLLECATTQTEETLDGRINVNLARVEVLASVPGIDEALADEIVRQRASDPAQLEPHQRDATWLLVDGLVKLDEMKKLLPYLTASGSVYRVQSVGFFDEGGTVARLEAVIDATESPPRMLSLRNLTPVGRGFDTATLGAEQ